LIPSLNDLRLVELERLILHEAHDERRLARLRERIEAEGVQRNPVIVAPHEDAYLVLDGAHRVHTMKEIGSRLVLAQVVEPPESAESWGHLLTGVDAAILETIDGVKASGDGGGQRPLAEIETAGGERVYLRSAGDGLCDEVEALWALQRLYPGGDVVRRVDPEGPVRLEDGEALIHYRPFTAAELVEVVRGGKVLPAGITRFRVRERILGVRFPLAGMKDGDPGERNAELRRFVEEHWRQNRIRYYGEPVVLFE
jgi:L-serine kinase (ATP) / ParB family transcriptional regulator, heme-responsive regulator